MSDELDDLFRQQLGSHATPPDADLARRLAELAAAERLDARFRAGLGAHASAPRRELWERLEDEHLRPVARRRWPAAAWWPLAVAALVLLGLLVGGGLWLGGSGTGRRATNELAGRPVPTQLSGPNMTSADGTKGRPGATRNNAAGPGATATIAATTGLPKAQALPQPPVVSQPIISNRTHPSVTSIASIKANRLSEKNNVFTTPQATDRRGAPSSRSVVTAGRAPRRTAPTGPTRERLLTTTQQRLGPDAAPAPLAKTGGQPAPVIFPPTSKRPVESTSLPTAPVLAATAPAPDVIEVEVRRGPDPTRPPAVHPVPAALVAVAASAPPAPRRPRLRLGNLLREAGHLARGEQVSLAEAAGLPESLTLRASLGGRSVSKTIEL